MMPCVVLVDNKFRILLAIPLEEQKGDLSFFKIWSLQAFQLDTILFDRILRHLPTVSTCLYMSWLFSFPVRCTEPPDTGSCRDSLTKWYYNPIQQDCFRFNFGGCQGNENRFETKDSCMKVCRGITGGKLLTLSRHCTDYLLPCGLTFLVLKYKKMQNKKEPHIRDMFHINTG